MANMAHRVWKVGTRRGIAYVEGREMAEQIASLTGRVLPPPITVRKTNADAGSVMAIYTDRKGKAFAYQIVFDLSNWDKITSMLGVVN